MAIGSLPESDLEIACPRCERTVVERFYGPCETCRAELRSTMINEANTSVAAEYEPKMNVVENNVAGSKNDS